MNKIHHIASIVVLSLCALAGAHQLRSSQQASAAMEQEISAQTLRLERDFEVLRSLIREELSGWHWIDHPYQQYLPLMDTLVSIPYRPWMPVDSQLTYLARRAQPLNQRNTSYLLRLDEILARASNCNNKEIAFRYGKTIILQSRAMTALESFGHSSMCLEKFAGIQVYDPRQEKYQLYFGAGLGCEANTNIKVEDGPLNQSTFTYTPQKVGIDSITVVVQHYDYAKGKYVIDTLYYPINVVDHPKS